MLRDLPDRPQAEGRRRRGDVGQLKHSQSLRMYRANAYQSCKARKFMIAVFVLDDKSAQHKPQKEN